MNPDPWMTCMRCGDFAAAWEISDRVLAERAARREDCSRWPRHLQFIWDGSPLDDKHVLVRCYHGLGDTIQYVRFLEALRCRARKVTLWVQPALLGLLNDLRGCDRLLPLHDGVPEVAYDTDIELMEIAHALRITLDDLPGRIPYVNVPACAVDPRCDRSLLHVGIAWRSGEWDSSRSIPKDALWPLSTVAGTALHSLQFPPEPLPFAVEELACRDIKRMAQWMRSLDLVISVDTVVAHLAGALGLPTWVLLNERPDWRWLEDRDDSPWYPTMRLFRHSTDWQQTVIAVANALVVERDRITAARCTRSDGYRASSG
jgi:hypothetical protein